jgi:hypothetical protein
LDMFRKITKPRPYMFIDETALEVDFYGCKICKPRPYMFIDGTALEVDFELFSCALPSLH